MFWYANSTELKLEVLNLTLIFALQDRQNMQLQKAFFNVHKSFQLCSKELSSFRIH